MYYFVDTFQGVWSRKQLKPSKAQSSASPNIAGNALSKHSHRLLDEERVEKS
jgi:hypothetical protein